MLNTILQALMLGLGDAISQLVLEREGHYSPYRTFCLSIYGLIFVVSVAAGRAAEREMCRIKAWEADGTNDMISSKIRARPYQDSTCT